MKLSENWLRQLVEIPVGHQELTERLTLAGLEVESVAIHGDMLEGVVVAEIIGAEPHPQADRLQVCTVDAGQDAPLTIVCGAPNAAVGLRAPLALVGATLPGGVEIKAAKLRGVESAGMLCSARELGLDNDASGLMPLPADAPVGTSLAAYLGLPDAVIELGLTPNRPDCLGMLGLSRDVAALFTASARWPQQDEVAATGEGMRGIKLAAGADCPRYLGRVVECVDVSASTPLWMTERLRRAGMRPHGIAVDVTNYVMLELGQPMHAFDNDVLQGDMVVRHAREGEKLMLLDGNEVALDSHFMVIADQAQVLAVAGVMGGLISRVGENTRDLFLESAHFAPAAIMGRARRLGLHTESSHRFERGVDPDLPERALHRATELLVSVAGGKPGPVLRAEQPDDLPTRAPVSLRRERLQRVLGLEIPDAEVMAILGRLDLNPVVDAQGWRVVPPGRRFDIEREEDLIEEVARIHGYQKIPVRTPSGEMRLAAGSETRLDSRDFAVQLVAREYHEAVCMAFVHPEILTKWHMDHGLVNLANPLTVDLASMRPSLLPGLVEALRHNHARQMDRVRLFECGHVFGAPTEAGQAPRETDMLAMVACGTANAEQWGESGRQLDFHDIKGDVESMLCMGGASSEWCFDGENLPACLHPGRAARVSRAGQFVGWVGELHPQLLAALDLPVSVCVAELSLADLGRRELPKSQPVPRFPRVRRDLAVEVDESTTWATVAACARQAAGSRLADLRLFDQYQGPKLDPGRKSLAMGLILQDRSRTLTDDEVETCVAAVVEALATQCAARLRG